MMPPTISGSTSTFKIGSARGRTIAASPTIPARSRDRAARPLRTSTSTWPRWVRNSCCDSLTTSRNTLKSIVCREHLQKVEHRRATAACRSTRSINFSFSSWATKRRAQDRVELRELVEHVRHQGLQLGDDRRRVALLQRDSPQRLAIDARSRSAVTSITVSCLVADSLTCQS